MDKDLDSTTDPRAQKKITSGGSRAPSKIVNLTLPRTAVSGSHQPHETPVPTSCGDARSNSTSDQIHKRSAPVGVNVTAAADAKPDSKNDPISTTLLITAKKKNKLGKVPAKLGPGDAKPDCKNDPIPTASLITAKKKAGKDPVKEGASPPARTQARDQITIESKEESEEYNAQSTTPTRQQPHHVPMLLLKDLTPNVPSPWAFEALVVARNPVRTWKNWQGEGKLLEVYVTDSLAGLTRLTLFNEAVDKFHALVAPGATCYFSGGRTKPAFSTKYPVEISFGLSSHIHSVPGQLELLPDVLTVRIADLKEHSQRSTATIIAVIHAIGTLKRVCTKKGKSLEKRESLLVDDSGSSMVCTTWGQLARANDDVIAGTVVMINDAVLSDYNTHRSASIGAESEMLHEPIFPLASQLREWYKALPSNPSFSPLTSE